MANPLAAFGSFFVRVFRWFTGSKAEAVAQQISDISSRVLPFVEQIAKMTPTRRDDEIIQVVRTFGLDGLENFLAVPINDRGRVLMAIALQVAGRYFPGVSENLLRAAIELALAFVRK